MLLKPNDKVLLVHRRLFEADTSRYFIGTVEAYESGVVKVTGQTCIRTDVGWVKKDQVRTKLISLVADGVMAYQFPSDVQMEALEFRDGGRGFVVLTDGQGFEFDMTERPRVA